MKKGVTPVVATVLLMTITFAAAGTLYTVVGDNINQAKNTQTNIGLNIGGIDAETCYVENNNTRIVLRNGLTEAVNASKLNLITNGRLRDEAEYNISEPIVNPQKSFEVEIDGLIGGNTEIKLTDGAQELTHSCIGLGDSQLYETSFEISGEKWQPYTTGRSITEATTSANDYVSIGDNSMKAARPTNGVGGYGGMARNFSTDYDILELDIKAQAENWGRTSIIVKNRSSGNHDTIWSRTASGTSYETGWMTKTFNISDQPADFTLIIGNDDRTATADENDHGWAIWADDIELAKVN